MITVTPEARAQVKALLARQSPETMLRVFISPGGCSGMSYGMQFDDQEQEGDQRIEEDGVRLVIDEMSAMYLAGSQLDYDNSLMGGGFKFVNPNAVKSCACGHSFDTGKDAASARLCH